MAMNEIGGIDQPREVKFSRPDCIQRTHVVKIAATIVSPFTFYSPLRDI